MYEDLVVEIRPEGDGVPLWVLHPIGGAVLFARRMAELMEAGRPVLGVQAQGLDGRVEPKTTVPELAEVYAGAILSRQSTGPFLITGPSFGGYLALEVSRILTDKGHEVALTGLFDAYGPEYPRKLHGLDYYRAWLVSFVRASVQEKVATIRRILSRSPFLKGAWRYESGDRLKTAYHTMAAPIRRVILANIEAARAYRPQPYSGHLHLFHATQTPKNWPGHAFDAEDNGWGPYALAGVSVTLIDGTHRTLMDDPTVQQVSRELDKVIKQVLAAR